MNPATRSLRASLVSTFLAFLLALAGTTPLLAQVPDSFNPNPDDEVDALAVQPDGKVLVGGWFANLGGQPRDYLGRVDADGVLDTNFTAQTDGPVYSFAIQPDGKIIVGGWFSELGGDWRDCLGRLHPDGSLDTTFNPGANSTVYGLAVQADGKIVVAGNFTRLGGGSRQRLARLNPDGSRDMTFTSTADDTIYCVALQPDGKILVGGAFTSLGSQLNTQPRSHLGRFNSDGFVDDTFNPSVNGPVYSLAVQPNGRILVGGMFTMVGGQNHTNITRLHPDGTPDATFFGSANGYVNSVALQANGKSLVAGGFTFLQPTSTGTHPGYGRLNSNGLSEYSGPPANPSISGSPVFSLAPQDDGRFLAGGAFVWSMNFGSGAQYRTNIARLTNELATQSLMFDGATIAWLRGGSSPEVWRTTFEVSTNGSDWMLAGAGTRIPGGWQLNGLAAPATALVRARGWVSGGGASAWIVETVTSPPIIRGQPVSQTNSAGSTATFSVQANGLGPLGYQWFKGDSALSNGGSVFGATTASLTLSNVLSPDAGSYAVVVSNVYGSVTSRVASLSVVVDLTITSQPASQTNSLGNSVTFAVQAAGPGPLSYRWFKSGLFLSDGGRVSGAATSSLKLNNIFGADAGGYSVVVSNAYGGVATSQTAMLTVLDPLITGQPTNRMNNAGTLAAFTVQALASPPLTYQWLKNGQPFGAPETLTGANGPTLTLSLTNVLGADAGGYAVVISNAYGSVTSRVATLTVADPYIFGQPVSLNSSLGAASATFGVSVAGTALLSYQWRKDGVALDGATSELLNLTDVQAPSHGRYDVVVSNSFGCVTSTPAFLTVNTANYDSFSFLPFGYAGYMRGLALQADGAILASGQNSGGYGLFRVPVDGAGSVLWGGPSEFVNSFATQEDGRIVFGGSFATAGGQPRNNFGRLLADFSLDPTFNPTASSTVNCLAIQPDGKMVVGGAFTNVAGVPRTYLCRFNSNGSLDPSFYPAANGPVSTLALQADGKILVGGSFTVLGGQARNRLGRLNADATLDLAFTAGVEGAANNPITGQANPSVTALAVQADGKILVGGSFAALGGQTRTNLGRLHANGTLDSAFNANADGTVVTLVQQADGRILAGGNFTTLSGLSRSFVGRLNNDGTPDTTFNPGADGVVYGLAVMADGRVLLGSYGLRRVVSPDVSTQSLSSDGTTVMWLRGGSCPEVWRTSFESSTDGTNWTSLGEGSRVPSGWQCSVPSVLATNSTIRARGWVAGGLYNGSSWFVESTLTMNPALPPRLVLVPGSAAETNRNGFCFQVKGLAGQVVVVESSFNCTDWLPMETLTLEAGQAQFCDPDSAILPHRFYRARLQ